MRLQRQVNAMSRRPFRIGILLVATALLVAGCESARFGGGRSVGPSRPSQGYNAPEPVASAVPSGSVTAEALPPPPGAASAPPPVAPGQVAALPSAPVPVDGPVPTPVPVGPAPSPVAGASRSGTVGGWTATEAGGGSCRINLSSSPALDLYRASASGCANKDLGRVTAWDFKDGEVYLYQPGGAVAARLRGTGGSLSGVLAKSGAPLTLAR